MFCEPLFRFGVHPAKADSLDQGRNPPRASRASLRRLEIFFDRDVDREELRKLLRVGDRQIARYEADKDNPLPFTWRHGRKHYDPDDIETWDANRKQRRNPRTTKKPSKPVKPIAPEPK